MGRFTQKDCVRRPRARNRGIYDNFCVEQQLSTALNECLQYFSHIGALRKKQNTCIVNLARGKKMFLQSCRPASVLPDKRVAITEQSQEGVIYALRQSRLTLSLDLYRRASWSLKIIF